MESTRWNRTKYSCYLCSMSTAATGNLSPLLFLTFRSMYGISYTLLGLLVLINFGTQLLFDLLFSFFSHRLNLKRSVRMMPVTMAAGLIVYALWPWIFPGSVYAGLVIGTVIFSAGSGLTEVLTSPVIEAIPDEHPERLLSRLHSCYAWGVVFVALFSTAFTRILGRESWQYLALIYACAPAFSSVILFRAPIPDMETPQSAAGTARLFKNTMLPLCIFAIFLGGASECTMSQWCSSYLEKALGIDKVWGDVFGVAVFGAALGLGRSLYGKFGKDISRILVLGAVGAAVCYLTAVLAEAPVIGLLACGLTGFCVSMLWPGSLIAAGNLVPEGGVAMFALMAAGGDLGASAIPQLVGCITDAVIAGEGTRRMAEALHMDIEQFGMKAGMLAAALCPIAAFFVYSAIRRALKRRAAASSSEQ